MEEGQNDTGRKGLSANEGSHHYTELEFQFNIIQS